MKAPSPAVRPLRAQVVRQDRAERTVTAMTDSQDDSGVDLYGVAVDRAAYADSPDAVYGYRQRHGDTSYTGIVCEVDVRAVEDGQVRGHEAVHRLRVDALVWHHARTLAPPALVKLLHRPGPRFRDALEPGSTTPLLDFDGPHGLRQTLWRLEETSARAVLDELSSSTLYIADGHHRTAAALEEWRAAGRPDGPGLPCVVYAVDGLRVSAFHRRVSGPLDVPRLLALLGDEHSVRPVAQAPTPAPGAMGLYAGRAWYDVRLRSARPAGAAGLDVSLLQSRVLDRLELLRTGRRPFVDAYPDATPLADLVGRCDEDGGALFTLAPPSTQAVLEVADGREVMPPKATFFEPKPVAGLFLRP